MSNGHCPRLLKAWSWLASLISHSQLQGQSVSRFWSAQGRTIVPGVSGG